MPTFFTGIIRLFGGLIIHRRRYFLCVELLLVELYLDNDEVFVVGQLPTVAFFGSPTMMSQIDN